jgi:hypothetical protein
LPFCCHKLVIFGGESIEKGNADKSAAPAAGNLFCIFGVSLITSGPGFLSFWLKLFSYEPNAYPNASTASLVLVGRPFSFFPAAGAGAD